jgi:hypothetical protein
MSDHTITNLNSATGAPMSAPRVDGIEETIAGAWGGAITNSNDPMVGSRRATSGPDACSVALEPAIDLDGN